MLPLLAKGPGEAKRYVPWSFMDMTGLINRLPALIQGADKWIRAFKENTGGVKLALGDIKAILMKIVGQQMAAEIFEDGSAKALNDNHYHDTKPFGHYRTKVWEALRNKYPSKKYSSKLQRQTLKDGENPAQFLHEFQRKWKEETGSNWNTNEASKALFKLYVKKAMPKEVRNKLNQVVGLMEMDWPVFSEYIMWTHTELKSRAKKNRAKCYLES